jgi:hypothetical protein
MKWFLICILFFIVEGSSAQSADFLLFKKKGKTIARYFIGSDITFTATSGAYIDAKIIAIKNDSVFLRQYIVQQVPTQLGVYILDTTTSYLYQYNYKDIKSIGKERKGLNWAGSGGALLGGGMVLTLASGIVYLVDKNKFSPQLLIASVALGGIGYLLTKVGMKGMEIGKKYTLEYVPVAAAK